MVKVLIFAFTALLFGIVQAQLEFDAEIPAEVYNEPRPGNFFINLEMNIFIFKIEYFYMIFSMQYQH